MSAPKYYEDKDTQYLYKGFNKVLDKLKSKGIWTRRDGFPLSIPYMEYSDGFQCYCCCSIPLGLELISTGSESEEKLTGNFISRGVRLLVVTQRET